MNFVLKLDEPDVLRVIAFYQDYKKSSNNEHIRFFAKTDFISVSVYKSGKVMFQGEDSEPEYDMWKIMLNISEEPKEKKKVKTPLYNDYFYPSIGSDEVGTGDFFGPVTVCAAYLRKEDIEFVKGLGIDDSKKISDDKILIIGEQLKDRVPFSLLTLHNEKFNELTKRGFNMNKIKAYLHNKAILNLLGKINGTPEVIIDQFAEEKLYFRYLNDETKVYRNVTLTTKAESKYASVAIGSIIARYAFLKHFDNLSKEAGYHLLKGANAEVDKVAARMIKDKGINYLYSYAKLNFKNLEKAKAICEDLLKR
ncbi:Ribonuclease HIII [Candidatus Izimaplasma bacterium HR1]|jgi:ribonuclease HIII|uniref:ribonuclease HIII n=1 Tax=Candidatus Izimoplasma sp. HR1 TaxID=1541959 RepID=UPI0004F74713|nr:Ribonuclease HIII [Candidatus Izimaplasma bacterium HR1]